ncbi:DMT family transporter [Wansuia hejianensis]|uniref:DMT family transporter n=1 Tax=Wansuia hejianensis TaxID=2763667 RepID=UPI002ED082DA
MNTWNRHRRGIMFIIMAAFFFALMSFFIRLSGDLPTMQKSFFRNAVASVAAAAMLGRSKEKFRVRKGSLPWLLIRSAAGTVGLIANYYAIDHMNISDANMLNKLSPFFAIIASIFVLKEKVSKTEWVAVFIAFGSCA